MHTSSHVFPHWLRHQCHNTLPCTHTLPLLTLPLTVVTGWMEHRLRGADLSSLEEWATSDAARQRLVYSIKTTGAPAPSS